jgi:hypothetical protein
MHRFEIIAHMVADFDCATAEEAAVLFRRKLLDEAGIADDMLHLAVWREEPTKAASPLPASLRDQLRDFFTALERYAGAAEDAFRERVAAILTSDAAATGAATDPSTSRPRHRSTPDTLKETR